MSNSVPPLEWCDYSFTPKGRNKEVKMLVLCVFTSGIEETQNDINASQCLPPCLVLMLLFQASVSYSVFALRSFAFMG